MKPRLDWIALMVISFCLLPAESHPSEDDETEEPEISAMEGEVVVEGDMLVTTYSEGWQSGSVSNFNKIWPNAIIPYIISDEYDEKQGTEIRIAMDAFEEKTCIRFIERKNDKRYILIVKENKEFNTPCLSSVGRQNKYQKVYLAEACLNSPGTVKHELMHAIGFVHEQSRTDRDNYVDIHYNNILNGMENGNFLKFEDHIIRLLNTSYDTKSIMHYEWNAFAIDDEKPTITAKDGSNITRNEDFSRTDILEINRLYKCNSGQYKWRPSDNGQVQQAKNCSFFGKDIHHQECTSGECTALCLSNSLCTHFTWDSEDNCYLTTDSSFKNIYPYKGTICGHITKRNSNLSFRDWENGQIKWAPRCDFFGLDFHQLKSGYKECGELCLNSTKCTHFTWEWQGNCYLKTLPKTVKVYPYEKSICGYVNRREFAIPWQDGENKQFKWAKDCDFFGYDFHEVKSKDKECSGLCLANSKCTHFTWDWEGNCHLKAAPNSTAVYPFKGAVCGYITQRKSTNFVWKDKNSGKIKWARDCDFFGYDIDEQKSKEEECSGLCLANMNCSHFTWDREGNCYLKNAPKSVRMYPFKGGVCGYITEQRKLSK